MDLPDLPTGPMCALSLPAPDGLVCHTPQPIPPTDDDDDDDEDDDGRGSGGGNIDPDDDEGGSDDDDDDDEDDTLWTRPGVRGITTRSGAGRWSQ